MLAITGFFNQLQVTFWQRKGRETIFQSQSLIYKWEHPKAHVELLFVTKSPTMNVHILYDAQNLTMAKYKYCRTHI